MSRTPVEQSVLQKLADELNTLGNAVALLTNQIAALQNAVVTLNRQLPIVVTALQPIVAEATKPVPPPTPAPAPEAPKA